MGVWKAKLVLVRELYSQGLKQCSCCKKIKPLEDFYISRAAIYTVGRTSRCKECCSIAMKERYRSLKIRRSCTKCKYYKASLNKE